MFTDRARYVLNTENELAIVYFTHTSAPGKYQLKQMLVSLEFYEVCIKINFNDHSLIDDQ